ncbi:fimbrial assembly protein [Halomonas piscis]|uniref:Fimbrial assembly protein n=1 Tax=Halomonas piscis TaxID=3031727 RepID=A0ABY9YXM5_9GAMM|nr:PilN domain-containing protein [Halomonas piscis]WNK19526.1 fimbrial assembly protein [Halomonas piscis]
MSVRINLLPWRAARRERRTRRVQLWLVGMLIAGTALGFGVARYYQAALDAQQERNQYIRQQTERLDEAIRDVTQYERQVEQFREQIALFASLQDERLQTIRLLNGVSQSVAQGVVYQRLARSDDEVSVTARAGSDRQISEQLRRIAQLPAMGVPRFSEVESESETRRQFRFRVEQKRAGDDTLTAEDSGMAKEAGQ